MKISQKTNKYGLVAFSLFFVLGIHNASAGIFDSAIDIFKSVSKRNEESATPAALIQESSVLRVTNQISSTNTDDQNMSSDGVIKAAVGPLRSSTENEVYENDQIQVYEVKEGDTVSDVAKIFGVSRNTVTWANDIKNGKLTPGEILIILPVNGVKHTVKRGDTVKSIAKKYKASEEDIISFNNLEDGSLTVGESVIVPDGQVVVDAPATKKPANTKRKVYASAGIGYYVRPIIGGIKTQGIHGNNAVDIAAQVGTPILAAAEGTVLVAKNSGYNGGYGRMVIISHPNGTQTVYAHLSNVFVLSGQSVQKGEQIGASGNSGRSTGPHLHFEIRGAENPF